MKDGGRGGTMKKALPAVLMAAAAFTLLLGYPRTAAPAASGDLPKFFVTNVEVLEFYTSSARFKLEANAYNPYGFPIDLDLSIQVSAPNNPGDTELLNFEKLSAPDFGPIDWDREFTQKEGTIRLYPQRYHTLRFWDTLSTEIPERLQRGERSGLFPYLYDNAAKLGLDGPMGTIAVTISGQARFVGGGVEFTAPIKELIRVPYPFRD